MKIDRGTEYIHIDLSGAEAMVLLEELETVRGGAKCVKLRQVCEGLQQSLALDAAMAPKKGGRPKSAMLVVLPRFIPPPPPTFEEMVAPWEADEGE